MLLDPAYKVLICEVICLGDAKCDVNDLVVCSRQTHMVEPHEVVEDGHARTFAAIPEDVATDNDPGKLGRLLGEGGV